MNKSSTPQIVACAFAAAVGLTWGASAYAESSFSSSLKLTTDYALRGASDTDGGPAVQGSFDWSHSGGYYTGIWASNTASPNNVELNYYAGYATALDDGLDIDVGVIYLHYPDYYLEDDDGEAWESFGEFKAALGFDAGFADLGLRYGHITTDDKQNRVSFSASVPIDQEVPLTLFAQYGINAYSEDDSKDYNWYLVGIGTEIEGFGLDIFYTGRDTSGSDKILGTSVSRSF